MIKILAVDDEEGIRKMISRRLGKISYEVKTVGTGYEALKILDKENFDLILLDHMMPEMDGMTTFEKIRNMLPSLPAIMITAHGSLHLAMEFMKAGGSDFVEKPIDFDILNIKIQKALEKSDLENKLYEAEIACRVTEESEALKSIVLSSVSHEFRTPLNVIRGLVQLMLRMGQSSKLVPEKQREFLHSILEMEENLETMVNDLLETALIEKGVKLFPEGVSLSEVVPDVLQTAMLEAEPKQKSVKIVTSLPESLPLVRADRKGLKRVLRNLMGNAVKFTDSGVIELRAVGRDKVVILSVTDTGIGIPDELQGEIFQRFFKADKSGAKPGVGIGLHICKKLVELMDGEIWVESEKGEGSVFYVSLPKWNTTF